MPPLFMNTPWLGATVATNEPAGFDVERGGAKMLMGEEERAERGEEGVAASVCNVWLYWLMIGLDMTTTLLFTTGLPMVTFVGLSFSIRLATDILGNEGVTNWGGRAGRKRKYHLPKAGFFRLNRSRT